MISSVASAQISNDRIAIGGVPGPRGCTPDYVESVYGAPTSQESGSNGDQTYLEYNYNNGYIIGFDGAGSQAVAVTCTTDNLATPDGVTVGMEASVLSDKYGTADHIYNFNDKSLYVYDAPMENSWPLTCRISSSSASAPGLIKKMKLRVYGYRARLCVWYNKTKD